MPWRVNDGLLHDGCATRKRVRSLLRKSAGLSGVFSALHAMSCWLTDRVSSHFHNLRC